MYGVASCVLYDTQRNTDKLPRNVKNGRNISGSSSSSWVLRRKYFRSKTAVSVSIVAKHVALAILHYIMLYIQIDSGGMCWNRAGAFWQALSTRPKHRYHRYSICSDDLANPGAFEADFGGPSKDLHRAADAKLDCHHRSASTGSFT